MATLAERIEALEKLIDSGATSITVDGMATQFDLPSARQRLAELKAEQSAASRPTFVRLTMSDG